MQRRAAEVCRAADRGAGGKAVRDTSVNWRAALGVGKRLKNVAKRHCARCRRLGSTEQAVWLTALGVGRQLKNEAKRHCARCGQLGSTVDTRAVWLGLCAKAGG